MPTHLKTIFFLLLALIFLGGTHCVAAEIVLVVHNNNSISTLSKRNAELIFLGKKTRWSSGDPVHVAVNNEKDAYDTFCREILKKTPGQYLLYRKKMLFNGSGIPPLPMENDDEVKNFVAESRQAIGFINRKSLDTRVKQLIIIE